MDLHQLRIFASVYQNKSFTKASEQLFISQPTISEHIKNLEADIGCRLFDRLGRTIAPTRQANLLYPKAMKILEEVEELKSELQEAEGVVQGELVFGASTIPGTYIIPRLAGAFNQRYPLVKFEIRIDDSKRVAEMVEQHEILCGVVGAKMAAKNLDYQAFYEDEVILVAAKGVHAGDTIQGKDLLSLPLIMREQGSGTREITVDYLKQAGIAPERLKIAAVLGSSAAIKEAVKAKLGFAFISRLAVKNELEAGLLRQIHIQGLKMHRSFFLITHQRRSLPPQYQLFCRALREAAKES